MDISLFKALHEGRNSIVYKWQKGDDFFTVKQLHPRLANDASAIQLFRAEAEQIHFPGITPKVIDYKEESGNFFIIKEYLEGQSLKKVNVAFAGKNATKILSIYIEILKALSVIHEGNIIHGDMKPSNILVNEKANGEVAVHILDLGLALNYGDLPQKNVQRIQYSMIYGSPEQMLNEPDFLGPWTDLFSLGICLYESLVGNHPYKESHPAAVMQLMLSQNISPHRRIPEALFKVIQGLTYKPEFTKPIAHYTAEEVQEKLLASIQKRKTTGMANEVQARLSLILEEGKLNKPSFWKRWF